MKLTDLRLFGDRCIVRFTSEGFVCHLGVVVAVGPDSLVEVGDEIMFSLYHMDFWVDEEIGSRSKHAVLEQAQVIATVGAKPAVDLPELEPIQPPTEAEQERFRAAADKAMSEQREKLGLPWGPCGSFSEGSNMIDLCVCGFSRRAHNL